MVAASVVEVDASVTVVGFSAGAELLTSISDIGALVVDDGVIVVSELSLDSLDSLDDEADDSSLEAAFVVWVSVVVVDVVVVLDSVVASVFVVGASKEANAFSNGVVGCSTMSTIGTVDSSFGVRNGSVLRVGKAEEVEGDEASVTGESGKVDHSGLACST